MVELSGLRTLQPSIHFFAEGLDAFGAADGVHAAAR
jgi:hypothetical protein